MSLSCPLSLPRRVLHVLTDEDRGALSMVLVMVLGIGITVTAAEKSFSSLYLFFIWKVFFSFMIFILICRNYFCITTLVQGLMSYAYLF